MSQSQFYSCFREYARKLSVSSKVRQAPLFAVPEDPTEPIDRPCLMIDCPIPAVHNRDAYRYLGQPVPDFLKDDLEKQLGEGARGFWGPSNPHPLIWQALWMGQMDVVDAFRRLHVLEDAVESVRKVSDKWGINDPQLHGDRRRREMNTLRQMDRCGIFEGGLFRNNMDTQFMFMFDELILDYYLARNFMTAGVVPGIKWPE